MKYEIEKKIPCFCIDQEGGQIIMGFLKEIKRIDSIDYRLYYDYALIIGEKARFVEDFEKVQSYNHLESMEFDGLIHHKAIKYIFEE